MIGLDTNVLVRYLAQDDALQSGAATRTIERLTSEAPGYISHIVLVELSWVLERCYGSSRADLATVIAGLLQTDVLVVADAATAWKALRLFQSGKADFADCMVERTAATAGCEYTWTFDRKAARDGGMRLLG